MRRSALQNPAIIAKWRPVSCTVMVRVLVMIEMCAECHVRPEEGAADPRSSILRSHVINHPKRPYITDVFLLAVSRSYSDPSLTLPAVFSRSKSDLPSLRVCQTKEQQSISARGPAGCVQRSQVA